MWRYNNYHKHDHISNIYMSDSNVKAEQYIQRCIEYGHTNYFTTNHGSFGDIFEAKMLCNKYGIRCVAGIEGGILFLIHYKKISQTIILSLFRLLIEHERK